MEFCLTGRWDDFENDMSDQNMQQYLIDIGEEDVTRYKGLHKPLGLSGHFVVRGIDTANNTYPQRDEVAFDKNGNTITVEVLPTMSVYDITVAMVKHVDTLFDGFPHHCFFEYLDIDPGGKTLTFDMGS